MKHKLVTILMVAFWGTGAWFITPRGQVFAADRYEDLQLFAKVLNLIQQYYVENVDTKKLIYGGIKGMLRELDPHTNFLPPEIYKEFESETSGEFGGLGIEITVQKGILTVISPIEDTPAFIAGVKAGDKIVTINGESTKGLSLAEAAQKMRGAMGSKVILGVYREGLDKPKNITVVRGKVKIKSVKYTELADGFAYIKITHFIENTTKDLRKIYEEHVKKNKKLSGLILDLRKNPGGLLDQAVQISDLFITKGVIVSTMGRDKKEKEIMSAQSEGTLPNFPLIILIDEYSASASEIVAGALKDNRRALIMGQKSFGKGSVQSVSKLGDGSGLKLTVARYYTPSGVSIQASGITPDVEVDNFDAEVIEKARIKEEVRRERDIKGHLIGDNEGEDEDSGEVDANTSGAMQLWYAGASDSKKEQSPMKKLLSTDFQVMQAYNYLRAWSVMGSFDKIPEELKTKKQ